jgi:cytoskeletal protein CcmA (bactofilin family)
MAKQTINIGSNANDGTGDPLRTAFNKINDNFTELYGSDNDLNTLDANLDVNNFIITTGVTNGNITITPNGTGSLTLGALTVSGTEISSADSTQITLKENLSVTGSLNAAGAATLGTSLTLAAGATITEFSTSTSLGTSNTLVPTQNAVKAYVDAQNVSQAITFVGDDSTGTAVNSGETFQILGGTGLTSAVTGDAITLDIDATVVTLTGGQTLTNKALTSPTISGTPTIIGVTATGATGTGNLVFSAGPTLTGTLAAATITASGTLSVTGNTTISGSLTTTDITTTGNQTVTGNITSQGTVFSDKIKSPATNANLAISAQGTGIVDIQSAMTTIGQTITGTASVTGQFNADNLRIDGNVISSTDTNGDIIITPAGSGQITLSSSRVGANQLNAVSVAVSNSVDTNTLRSYSSNADIVVQPQGTGTVDFKVPAQSTVGSAGAASALPANPTGYFTIKVNGSTFVVPYYAQS